VLTPPLLFFFAVAGVISTSPLKLELEFEPVLDNCTWYLCCTYQYMSRINFTGFLTPGIDFLFFISRKP